jgi:hypothetical protein
VGGHHGGDARDPGGKPWLKNLKESQCNDTTVAEIADRVEDWMDPTADLPRVPCLLGEGETADDLSLERYESFF